MKLRFTRLFPLLAALCVCFAARADEDEDLTFEVDGVYYHKTYSGECEVTDNDQSPSPYAGDIVIPKSVKYDGEVYYVVGIADSAFSGAKSLTSVTLPSTLTRIGYGAFRESSITSIEIPNSVTTIGEYAFQDCVALTSIGLPNKLKAIQSGTFYNCSALSEIKLPESLMQIYYGAFYYCSSLKTIEIPANCTNIDETGVFEGCTAMESFSVASGNNGLESDSGVLYLKNKEALVAYPANSPRETFTVPDGVCDIYAHAFSYTANLKQVTLPNSVKLIHNHAFWYCSLESIKSRSRYPALEALHLHIPV